MDQWFNWGQKHSLRILMSTSIEEIDNKIVTFNFILYNKTNKQGLTTKLIKELI